MSSLFNVFKKVAYTFRGRHLNRYYFIRLGLNFLLRVIKPKSVIVEGNRIFLDKDDSMRLSILEIYEPLMVKLFKEQLKKGDIVLDIGAHIGYYTLLAAKCVGSKGKVYAFEPNAYNCKILTKNLKVNGYKNVTLINKAVAESTKKGKLFISGVSTGMHSLIDIDNNASSSTLVDIVSIDDFFGKNIPRISLIKMDIEGGEYSALKGMSNLIGSSKHLAIFTEFSPFSIKKAKKSPLEFLKFLKKYGFKIYSIDESRKKDLPVENLQTFLSSCPLDRDWHINLMAVK